MALQMARQATWQESGTGTPHEHPGSAVEGQLMPSREEFDNVKLAEGAWRSVGQFWMKVSLRLVHI